MREGGNFEAHRLEADLTKIVEATAKLFGELPSERYTFFFHLTDRRDGGLEHRSSTSIVVPRTIFRPESDYQSFLRLSSHEYFHRYNVKRIRPKVLGPFDYTKENYTHLLWAMEGTTDYYTPLLVRRAGIISASKYLEGIAKDIRRYREIPGRLVTSLEEASFGTWVDLYQKYEETDNQSVSYYLKGGLVSLCLDLEIRHRTENRSSLDDVMRSLWREYGTKEIGLGEEELLAVAQRVTGLDLSEFFRRYVSGTDEVDFASFARFAGLALAPEVKKEEPGEDAAAGYLGIEFDNSNGWTRVRSVRSGTPAAWRRSLPGGRDRRPRWMPGLVRPVRERAQALPGGFGGRPRHLPTGIPRPRRGDDRDGAPREAPLHAGRRSHTARPRDLRIVARDAVDAPCQGGRANCSVNYGTPGERCAGPAKSSPRTLRVNPQTTWPSWWTDGSSSGPWGVGRIIGTGWPRAS